MIQNRLGQPYSSCWKEIYRFCFVLLCKIEGNFQVQAPGGLIFGGTYTWRGLFSEFYGTLLWVSPVSWAGLFTGQARLISCFLMQFSLCLLYMRPGYEMASWPGLPRSWLFELRSREAPTSPPLACEYGSRLSSLLVPLGTFHEEGGHGHEPWGSGPHKKEEWHNF